MLILICNLIKQSLPTPNLLESFANHCVIIDEIQEMPELFGLLEALVDKDKWAARFVILGSDITKNKFVKAQMHSLAELAIWSCIRYIY